MDFLVRCARPTTKSQTSTERSLKVLDKEGPLHNGSSKQRATDENLSVNVYEPTVATKPAPETRCLPNSNRNSFLINRAKLL